jgi:hypothetical protein
MGPGTQFMVIESGDSLIFKVIQPPTMDDFDELLAKTAAQAKKAGLKKSDITDAIKRVRAGRKRK